MKQKFPVALGPEDWGVDHLDALSMQVFGARADPLNRSAVRRRIADDPALTDTLASRLKLWLDKDHGIKLTPGANRRANGGQNQRRGNERDIHGEEADPLRQFAGL